MSRYALEWAKEQRPVSAEAKVLLLVLADYAEGLNSKCTLSEAQLANDASIERPRLASVITPLETANLVVAEVVPRPDPQNDMARRMQARAAGVWGEHWHVRLSVPADWRARRRCSRGSGPAIYAQRTAVYRLYGSADVLIYVGISDKPRKRFEQHRRKQRWWPEVVTREIEWFDDRYAAEVEEFWAITREGPLYNVRHSQGLE